MENQPLVGIIMGSKSDLEVMTEAAMLLERLEIGCEMRIASAHRTPDAVTDYAKTAGARGLKAIIAGAGASAALPGVVAAHTLLPVIGVPLNATSLGGIDALLSIAQMPAGVPVATMAIGKAGAKNAAYFAARIVALQDARTLRALETLRESEVQSILAAMIPT